jgi:hypothetical protein
MMALGVRGGMQVTVLSGVWVRVREGLGVKLLFVGGRSSVQLGARVEVPSQGVLKFLRVWRTMVICVKKTLSKQSCPIIHTPFITYIYIGCGCVVVPVVW